MNDNTAFPIDCAAPAREFPHRFGGVPAPDPHHSGGWRQLPTLVDGDYLATKVTPEAVLIRGADDGCLPVQHVTLALGPAEIDALMAELARAKVAHSRLAMRETTP